MRRITIRKSRASQNTVAGTSILQAGMLAKEESTASSGLTGSFVVVLRRLLDVIHNMVVFEH